MLDYDKRDEKITQKIEQIQNAPPELRERLLGKALRALHHMGVKQARDELDWCQTCLGRGYYNYCGLTFGACAPSVKELQKQFCACKRGQGLKEIYGKLGDWNRPRVILRSEECCSQGGRVNAEGANTKRTCWGRNSSAILNPPPLTEEDRRELMKPSADIDDGKWLEIPAFLRRQSNTPPA
jgi:hypothetical protein